MKLLAVRAQLFHARICICMGVMVRQWYHAQVMLSSRAKGLSDQHEQEVAEGVWD